VQPGQVAAAAQHPVAVMVDERLRGYEGEQGPLRAFGGRHALHARPPLFRDEIVVTAVYDGATFRSCSWRKGKG
jgi:hypothetical protein